MGADKNFADKNIFTKIGHCPKMHSRGPIKLLNAAETKPSQKNEQLNTEQRNQTKFSSFRDKPVRPVSQTGQTGLGQRPKPVVSLKGLTLMGSLEHL